MVPGRVSSGAAVAKLTALIKMHRALHRDLEPLEIVCMHYRLAHGDAMILTQRRLIAALLRAFHEILERTRNKTHTILELTQRLATLQWELFLLRGWRRSAQRSVGYFSPPPET